MTGGGRRFNSFALFTTMIHGSSSSSSSTVVGNDNKLMAPKLVKNPFDIRGKRCPLWGVNFQGSALLDKSGKEFRKKKLLSAYEYVSNIFPIFTLIPSCCRIYACKEQDELPHMDTERVKILYWISDKILHCCEYEVKI